MWVRLLCLNNFYLSDLTVTSKTILCSLVVDQCELESGTLTSPIWPVHIHRWNIASHNIVTEIKKTPTGRKIGTNIAFWRNTLSKITICQFTPLLMQELWPFLCPNPISTWYLPRDMMCCRRTLWFEQNLISQLVMNQVLRWAGKTQFCAVSGVSGILTSYDHYLVDKSLAVFAIFPGCYQEPL